MNREIELIDWLRFFNFDKERGVLTWRCHPNASYSKKLAGKIAGGPDRYGYLRVRFNGNKHLLHRVVFFLANGYLPKVIDHINGVVNDNRPKNLRAATNSENAHNQKLKRNNKSGVKGVNWNKSIQKWQSRVQIDGRRVCIGSFDGLKEAEMAIKFAREELHGEFANHG